MEWIDDLGVGRPVVGPDDAERFTAEALRALGFPDAAPTGRGADEGVDVAGGAFVCQVKHQAAAVGRPELQRLVGAGIERGRLVFFALNGYSTPAIGYGNRHHVALFVYSQMGDVAPVNAAAKAVVSQLCREAAASPEEAVSPLERWVEEKLQPTNPQRLESRVEALGGRLRAVIREATRLAETPFPAGSEKRRKRRLTGVAAQGDLALMADQFTKLRLGIDQLDPGRFRTAFGYQRHLDKLDKRLDEFEKLLTRYEKRAGLYGQKPPDRWWEDS